MSAHIKDLVVLVEGTDDQKTVQGLLLRHQALKIRPVMADVFVHPNSGPGCLNEAHTFLRQFHRTHAHALVIFDRVGCGQDERSASELEAMATSRLQVAGWQESAAVIVIDPELEAWVWSESPHVERVLGWAGQRDELLKHLTQQGFWRPSAIKPHLPKEAMDEALRVAKKPRSSALFSDLTKSVSLSRCADTRFMRLKSILTAWFGVARD